MLEFLILRVGACGWLSTVLEPLLKNREAGNFSPINNDKLAIEFVNSAELLQDPVK